MTEEYVFARKISAVLADDDIMLNIKPGEHGSTFGGNPIAAKVSIAALQVIKDEHLMENAERLGKIFREEMSAFKSPMIEKVRGKGLLNAIIIKPHNGKEAWDEAWWIPLFTEFIWLYYTG